VKKLSLGAAAAAAGIAALAAPLAQAGPAPDPLAALARGARAFRAGAYAEAQRALAGAVGRGLKNDDWARYLHAESAFYAGAIEAARADFEKVARMKQSRFADVAAFRAADCLWSAGAHDGAAARYTQLTRKPPAAAKGIDLAVARFRIARAAEERKKPAAASLYLALYREMPAHPLATEAKARLPQTAGGSGGAGAPPAGGAGGAAGPEGRPAAQGAVSPEDQLRRAEALTRDRHWTLALDELAKLPPDLPAPLKVERDYQIGMTKFQMRRDYPKAAELLLAAAPALSGDKAASALFHGTRALSRIDRDDEAIAGYKQVVARFPSSRFAAEAQYLAGWLEYNRGRFADSLPALRAALDRYGSSPFADDAAWCVAFAHFQLGQLAEAAAALERYARLPATGMTADERTARVAYWRARLAAKRGAKDEALAGYRDINRRWPFSFYGLAARARLGEAKEKAGVELPPAAPLPASVPGLGAQDPALARAVELRAAGLDVEAGWELAGDEKGVLRRLGDRYGARVLLTRYLELKQFHRAHVMAESRNAGALATAPEGAARLWWEAAYPRAYRELVEKYGAASANPDLFLYAIMRKESAFSPWDVSSADARGLMQMIPPTSVKVAEEAGIAFQPDELFDPDTNVRLGAAYIGGLHRKFGSQIPLTAGAFNAGPKAMARWCEQHGRHPLDEFVELVAFHQTREYIKRVAGIYARYRHLYGPTPYELPLTVDPRVAPTGPDY
jgi:soluble lytic murein transglycosylase